MKKLLLWIIWAIIFLFLIVAYAFRFELNYVQDRIVAVLLPERSWTNSQGQLVIARNRDGHFYLSAKTDQATIRFLVDTGASDVALTKEDAIRMGFNPTQLKYTKRYSTANGTSYGAPVIIKQLTIQDKTFFNIKAHVSSGKSDISLLGMSFINNFSDFKITKDMLILE